MTNLYYIRNIGCDDETAGLVELTDEDFPKFKEFIENLNKNSTYQCMPEIFVYKVTWDMFREATEADENRRRLYFKDKVFTFKADNGYWEFMEQLEEVLEHD